MASGPVICSWERRVDVPEHFLCSCFFRERAVHLDGDLSFCELGKNTQSGLACTGGTRAFHTSLAMHRKVRKATALYTAATVFFAWALFKVGRPSPSCGPAILTQLRRSRWTPQPASIVTRKLTFLTADLHDGPRVDLPSMLNAMGHRVILAGHKLNRTSYPEVFAHPLTEQVHRLAPFLQGFVDPNDDASESNVHSLVDFYEADTQFQSVDAFICSFPASFCEAWVPFNKTLIWWPVHRYAMGRCGLPRWTKLNEHLHASVARGDVIAAGSVYDAEYIRYFTGIRATLLPTSALWYASDVVFKPTRPEILVGPLQRQNFEHLGAMNADGRYTYAPVKALYKRFTLQDIASHRAVVLMPYAVLSYGMTELYAMGVPLLVPDLDFLMELGTMIDTKLTEPSILWAWCTYSRAPPSKSSSAQSRVFGPRCGGILVAICRLLSMAPYHHLFELG